MCVNMLEIDVHVRITIQSVAQIDEIASIGQRFAVCLAKTVLLPTIQTLVHRIDQKFRVRINAHGIEAIIGAIPYRSYRCLNFARIVRCATSHRCTNIPMQLKMQQQQNAKQVNRTKNTLCTRFGLVWCVDERVLFFILPNNTYMRWS